MPRRIGIQLITIQYFLSHSRWSHLPAIHLMFRCFHFSTHYWNAFWMLLGMVAAYLWMWMMSENLWPFRERCKFGDNRIHNGEWTVQLRYRFLAINLRTASISNPEAFPWRKINASGQSSGLLEGNKSGHCSSFLKRTRREQCLTT